MKPIPMTVVPFLLAFAIGSAQDNATVNQTAADNPPVQNDESTEDASLLNELGWMVGRWVDEGEEATITTDCTWTNNHKFLSRRFKIMADGQVTLKGNQMIGWDPIARQIRSWTFDSEGGFGEGRWIQDGNCWLVKTSFVLATGERASAINVITHVDNDTMRWQSTNREIGGELQPNIAEVTVVRQSAAEDESQPSENEESAR